MITESFKRPTGQVVSSNEIIATIADYIKQDPYAEYEFTVGTDSQTFADCTKIVEVIALHKVGRGGIFFYNTSRIAKIKTLRDKIYEETTRSLEIADGLLLDVEVLLDEDGIDINELNIHFQIHCDIGKSGKTKDLIKEIVGWVTSEGYECLIKPDSYTANAIADKYSK